MTSSSVEVESEHYGRRPITDFARGRSEDAKVKITKFLDGTVLAASRCAPAKFLPGVMPQLNRHTRREMRPLPCPFNDENEEFPQ